MRISIVYMLEKLQFLFRIVKKHAMQNAEYHGLIKKDYKFAEIIEEIHAPECIELAQYEKEKFSILNEQREKIQVNLFIKNLSINTKTMISYLTGEIIKCNKNMMMKKERFH